MFGDAESFHHIGLSLTTAAPQKYPDGLDTTLVPVFPCCLSIKIAPASALAVGCESRLSLQRMDVVPALQLYQNKPEGVLAVCDNCTGFL